ncbi:MAG: hypothetical protein F4X80_03135, partial [Chloroflexi bacterium]|nr:hypothetical protein [Chloroflexota bacterium]
VLATLLRARRAVRVGRGLLAEHRGCLPAVAPLQGHCHQGCGRARRPRGALRSRRARTGGGPAPALAPRDACPRAPARRAGLRGVPPQLASARARRGGPLGSTPLSTPDACAKMAEERGRQSWCSEGSELATRRASSSRWTTSTSRKTRRSS